MVTTKIPNESYFVPKTKLHKILHKIQAQIYKLLEFIFMNIYLSKRKFAWCETMEHGVNAIAKWIISFVQNSNF